MSEKGVKEEYYKKKPTVLYISNYFLTHLQEQKQEKKKSTENPQLQNLTIIIPGNSLGRMLSLWNMTVLWTCNIPPDIVRPISLQKK